jgi:hypothetical protein
MWLTTSTPGSLVSRSVLSYRILVLFLCHSGSTVPSTGDRSFKDRPRIYFPRVLTHTFIFPHSVIEYPSPNTGAGCSPIWCHRF